MATDTGYTNATIKSARRFYTLACRDALRLLNGMDGVFRARAAEVPHTDLPADFPLRSKLVAVDYSAVEDLDGATESELVALGLSTYQARAVLAAFALL